MHTVQFLSGRFGHFTDQTGNCNPEKNIWNKIEKFSKTGQEKKSLISTFARFFECYYQSLISEMETGHWALCLRQI